MDMTEMIIDRIRRMPNPPCFVGEFIPEDSDFPYVYVGKGSENYSDDYQYPATIDSVNYDVEVASDDIVEARELASQLKKWLMDTPLHGLKYVNDQGQEQTIHGILVTDHGDGYVPRIQDSDERAYVASIDVEAINGELT